MKTKLAETHNSGRNSLKYWILYILFFVAIMASGIKSSEPSQVKTPATLPLLTEWPAGSFYGSNQAADDTIYQEIRLTMTLIWQHVSPGLRPYVKQAVADPEAKPCRHRVYFLTQVDDSTFRSDIYYLPRPVRFVGAGKRKNPLAEITPDSLDPRESRSFIMRFNGQAFASGTVGKVCGRDLGKAACAASEV